MNLSTGQKVVCIDSRFHPAVLGLYTALPMKGLAYVIRDIRLGINLGGEGDVSVLLVGVVNPKADSKSALERGFRADRFRPLDEMREESKQTSSSPQPCHHTVLEPS